MLASTMNAFTHAIILANGGLAVNNFPLLFTFHHSLLVVFIALHFSKCVGILYAFGVSWLCLNHNTKIDFSINTFVWFIFFFCLIIYFFIMVVLLESQ